MIDLFEVKNKANRFLDKIIEIDKRYTREQFMVLGKASKRTLQNEMRPLNIVLKMNYGVPTNLEML